MTSLSTRVSAPVVPAQPVPPRQEDLDLPTDAADLEGWILAVLCAAGPARLRAAIAAAEAIATERFPERDVVRAMRRVLTVHLT